MWRKRHLRTAYAICALAVLPLIVIALGLTLATTRGAWCGLPFLLPGLMAMQLIRSATVFLSTPRELRQMKRDEPMLRAFIRIIEAWLLRRQRCPNASRERHPTETQSTAIWPAISPFESDPKETGKK